MNVNIGYSVNASASINILSASILALLINCYFMIKRDYQPLGD